MTDNHRLVLSALLEGACTISALAYHLRRTPRETRAIVKRLKQRQWVSTARAWDLILTRSWGDKPRVQKIVIVKLTETGYGQAKNGNGRSGS